jgi:lysophospholipase L1-like esterase
VAHEGAAFYDGDETAGIRVWQGGRSGAKATDFATNTGWVNSIQTWNLPDLVVINLGYNDIFASSGARTAAQVKTDLQAIITLVKNRATALGGVTPSIVLMASFNVTATGSSPVDTWANAVKAIYEIAATDDDVCVFDYQHWFGKDTETSVSTRGGILVADGLHPTDGGAAIIGGAMANFVLDSAERTRDVRRYGVDPAGPVANATGTAQGPGFATDTYLAGSACLIPAGRLKPGTAYRCRLYVSKTAAGVATPIVTVRTGTSGAGAVGDTARAVLTFLAQTGVGDSGYIDVDVVFNSVGTGTAAVLQAAGVIDHVNGSTGLVNTQSSVATGTSSGFDSSTATVLGLSLNAGASAAWTVQLVRAELLNLA